MKKHDETMAPDAEGLTETDTFGKWRIFHKKETGSTNTDALAGRAWDVFTADMQTHGRGRLDHKWVSAPGENLMMSAVVGVGDLPVETAATLPLAVGLAVVRTVRKILSVACGADTSCVMMKWPNDVYVDGRKICGILCERNGDSAICGIGVNANQETFPPEIAGRATSVKLEIARRSGNGSSERVSVRDLRNGVLSELEDVLSVWRNGGLAAFAEEIAACDYLRGRRVSVKRTDDDAEPASGVCGGILPDGSLDVGGEPVYAGEAHVCLG